MNPSFHRFTHPLLAHKLARLRDAATGHSEFRELVKQLAALMVYEATRELPTIPCDVRTPVAMTKGHRLAKPVTVVPILRAGLCMAEGVLSVMPEARVGHLGLSRDEATLKPSLYLERLPKDAGEGPILIVDPMLATGGSIVRAIAVLQAAGAKDIRVLAIVASPEGVQTLCAAHPNVQIYAAALDDRLNEHGFIVPGLGDAGDRMFGTV